MEDISIRAQEELTCRLLIDHARAFYSDPQNRRAYESWLAARIKHEARGCGSDELIRLGPKRPG